MENIISHNICKNEECVRCRFNADLNYVARTPSLATDFVKMCHLLFSRFISNKTSYMSKIRIITSGFSINITWWILIMLCGNLIAA